MAELTITADSDDHLHTLADALAERNLPVRIVTNGGRGEYGPDSTKAHQWTAMTPEERRKHLEYTFGRFPVRLPEGYRFNRDELYDR